jgi:hypothetical protein
VAPNPDACSGKHFPSARRQTGCSCTPLAAPTSSLTAYVNLSPVTHCLLAVVPVSHPVEQLAPPAVLHHDVHVRLILIRSSHVHHVQRAAQLAQDEHLQ